MKRLEHGTRTADLQQRWLLAPIYVGLVLSVLCCSSSSFRSSSTLSRGCSPHPRAT